MRFPVYYSNPLTWGQTAAKKISSHTGLKSYSGMASKISDNRLMAN